MIKSSKTLFSASGYNPIKDLYHLIYDVGYALAKLSRWSRWVHIFYLSGPFILLIERSPADFWMSLCGLIFLGRCVVIKDWGWTRYFWVRSILAFWFIALLSASLSAVPAYSLIKAFGWIRFPLFAFASCFWLARDRRIIAGMVLSMAWAC